MTSGNIEERAEGILLMKPLWKYYEMRKTCGCNLVMQSCKFVCIVAMENARLHPELYFPQRWRIHDTAVSSQEMSCELLCNFSHPCSREMLYFTLKYKQAQGRGSKVIMRMGTVWREKINQLFSLSINVHLVHEEGKGEALFNSKTAW